LRLERKGFLKKIKESETEKKKEENRETILIIFFSFDQSFLDVFLYHHPDFVYP